MGQSGLSKAIWAVPMWSVLCLATYKCKCMIIHKVCNRKTWSKITIKIKLTPSLVVWDYPRPPAPEHCPLDSSTLNIWCGLEGWIDLTVVDAMNLVTLGGVTNDTKQKNLYSDISWETMHRRLDLPRFSTSVYVLRRRDLLRMLLHNRFSLAMASVASALLEINLLTKRNSRKRAKLRSPRPKGKWLSHLSSNRWWGGLDGK